MPADPNTNKLDYAGLQRYHGKIQQQLTQQSQQIAALDSSKADKATEDARYKKQQTEIQFLLDAAKGQIAEVVTDDDEAYSKAVPTYTSAQAKFVDVKKIGAKSVVKNQKKDKTGITSLNTVGGSYSASGVTITNVDGKTYHIAGTSSASITLAFTGDTIIPSGHKILIRGIINGAGSTYRLRALYTSGGIEVYNNGVYTLTSDTISNGLRMFVSEDATVNIDITPEYIDLTQWFNGDAAILDSITSPEDAYALGVPRTYIPYNAGEIISADCDKVVSVGKNLLPYPYPDTTKTTNGITFTDNGDGSVTVNGSSTGTAYFHLANNQEWFIESNNHNNGYYGSLSNEITEINFGVNVNNKKVYISIPEGETFNNIKVYPMIEKSEVATAYVPYVGTLGTLNIPVGLRTAHPLRSAGTAHDEYNLSRKYTIKRADVGIIGDNILFDTIDTASTGIRYGMTPSGSFSKFVQGTLNILDNRGDAPVSGAPISSGAIRTVINAIAIYDNAFTDLETANAIITANHITLIGELATPVYYYDPTSPELAVNGGTIVPDATHIVDPESYFPDGTYLPVEDGGSLTFHQDDSEFPIPNTEDFYYVLEAST